MMNITTKTIKNNETSPPKGTSKDGSNKETSPPNETPKAGSNKKHMFQTKHQQTHHIKNIIMKCNNNTMMILMTE